MDALHVSTDPHELDIELIHRFLSEDSHWAEGVTLETVRKSIEHSLCFGGYLAGEQVAFCRVVTDYTRFGYVMDVFVLPAYRGRGFAQTMLAAMLAHPALHSVTFMLRSTQAPELYKNLAFRRWSIRISISASARIGSPVMTKRWKASVSPSFKRLSVRTTSNVAP